MMENAVKTLLGIDDADTTKDGIISQIVTLVSGRLRTRLGTTEIPEELQYIVIEVSVARFNRRGDEGMSSYSQEGASISYANMFAEFEEDIAAWKDKQGNGIAQKGGFKFL